MIVAIHQPNFLPHAGYFAKMAAAQAFIAFDTAQYTSGSYINRVRLLSGGKPAWATVPILASGRGRQHIRDVEIRRSTPWRDKLLKRLRQDYGRAPFFAHCLEPIERIVQAGHDRLAALNIELLAWVRSELGMLQSLAVASELESGMASPAPAGASEHLVALVRALGGTVYLSGPSGRDYLDASAFARAGVELRYFDGRVAAYTQGSGREYVPGLSILDMLMWLGPAQARRNISGSPQAGRKDGGGNV